MSAAAFGSPPSSPLEALESTCCILFYLVSWLLLKAIKFVASELELCLATLRSIPLCACRSLLCSSVVRRRDLQLKESLSAKQTSQSQEAQQANSSPASLVQEHSPPTLLRATESLELSGPNALSQLLVFFLRLLMKALHFQRFLLYSQRSKRIKQAMKTCLVMSNKKALSNKSARLHAVLAPLNLTCCVAKSFCLT